MLSNKKIGFALTGSFCTIKKVLKELERLVEDGADVYPIVSESVIKYDTRFGTSEDIIDRLKLITKKDKIITNIVEAEPIGPKNYLDAVVVAPCTGNTLSKIANGITDSCVTMSCKAQLRNEKPVIIGISTNDGLSGSLVNISKLINRKNIYFIPFGQDNPEKKKNSLVANFEMLIPTIESSLEMQQIQPLLI